MIITIPFKTKVEYVGRCSSSSLVPAESVDISAELNQAIHATGRIVKEVPKDRALLVDNCWGGGILKILSDDCQFFVPDNDHQWQVVKPILELLARRKVQVLTEINFSVIKENCRKSFYSSDGTLINNTFERENLTPEKMAEAGFVFAGDASNVKIKCYFDPEHKLGYYQFSDKLSHPPFFMYCSCMKSMARKVCVLSTEDGQIVPVQLYNVMNPVSSNRCCKGATLLTHCGAPIKILPFSEVMLKVDAISRDMADFAIQGCRASVKMIDQRFLESQKKLIHLTHFSHLLRDYELVSQDFKTQLQGCEIELHSSEIAVSENLLSKMLDSSVVTEVEETVNKLVNYRMAKETAMRMNVLPATYNSIRVGIEQVALKELQEWADSYAHKCFVDEQLNSLVTDGIPCCITINQHVNDITNERLMSLLDKGCELLKKMIGISEVIKGVLKPFMVQSPESVICRPEIKLEDL